MRPSKARFVTVCQQVLAIGTVVAALGPAADVVSLDVVISHPGARVDAIAEQPTLTRLPGTTVDRRGPDVEKSAVETAPVEPVVTDVPLTPVEAPAADPADTPAQAPAEATAESVSKPQKVDGFTTVGVTWSPGTEVADDQIEVLARTRTDGTWSEWTPLEYHDEHAPDPESPEAATSRPGTDPLIVGDVDEVQTKTIAAEGVTPEGLSMAVVEPGESKGTEVERAAIDTAALDAPEAQPTVESSEGDLALQAGTYTPKPQIYSRAQWGANEAMRDASSLRYFEVHAGFVHHTVNANNYTADQVPGIIRSIYAYHTQTRGWSDVGYNFLVDRFGRIWEGRFGGVDRPVVGAHTSGYNDYAFAMSAIGNFETAQPSSSMLAAYGKLMGWKLSLHGIAAGDTSQRVGDATFPAINGHRDAGSTACPGKYLYAQLPNIRKQAAAAQASWSGRNRVTDLLATTQPDLVLRRGSDKKVFVLPTRGMMKWLAPKTTGTGWTGYDAAALSPDLTGDGRPDMLVRAAATGVAGVRPGAGNGTFGALTASTTAFRGYDMVTPVGDLNRDGRNDVVARVKGTGNLYLIRSTGPGAWSRTLLSQAWAGYNLTTAAGDISGDKIVDVLARDTSGRLWLHKGTTSSTLAAPTQIAGTWAGYDAITGYGDFNADGRTDLYGRSASSGFAYVFPGYGDGRFGHPLGAFRGPAGLTNLSGGNVIGTADADVVGLSAGNLVVLQNHGDQNILQPTNSGTTFADSNLVLNVGDWDRDGKGDVMTRTTAGVLQLRRGLGNGTFAAPTTVSTAFGNVSLLAAVGDMTGDGWPDLMGQPSGGAMRIYPGKGATGIATSYVARSAATAAQQLGLGRWNSDGAPDSAFRVGTGLSWQAGNGPGGLTGGVAAITVNLAPYDWVLSPGDVDGNGRPDLIVREKDLGYLWMIPGTATGFGGRLFLAEGIGGYDLAG